MMTRALIAAVLVAAAGLVGARAASTEASVGREPLAAFPLALGDWRGYDTAPLADDIVGQLGVDDYISRQYMRADGTPIGVYVGYYDSQRQGDTIHSPQNCLPGAGWQPVQEDVVGVQAGGRTLPVNRFVIQKGMDRQVVYYWYQGRGRVVANEYANKAYLMYDAARLNRTNGGLVRLITPVSTTVDAATSELSAFTAALFPHLDRYMP